MTACQIEAAESGIRSLGSRVSGRRIEDQIIEASAANSSRKNIARQFEFLQNAWVNSTKFSGLAGESDPLLGNRVAISGCPVTNNFTKQKDGGLRRRVLGMPQFIKVRGGAYFFMPGIKALRYLAQDPSAKNP